MTTPDLPDPPWWRRPKRYAPDFALPPYRYVPLGRHPHPTMDAGGHMPTKPEEPVDEPSPLAWMTNPYFLRGVDLYNTFYFWEAQETWEPLWRRLGKKGPGAAMIKALIMTTGALLKVQCKETEGVVAFWTGADQLYLEVVQSDDEMWGLDVRKTRGRFARYFAPLVDKGVLPVLDRRVPKLLLPM